MLINLGCGKKKVPDSIGVDFRKTSITDKIHDLTVYPWPFKDEEFDGAVAADIVEHMVHVIPFIDECWRIVKPGAHLAIRTTNFMHEQAYRDPTHHHFFTLGSFDYFDPTTGVGKDYGWYTDKKWEVLERRIHGRELIFDLKKVGVTP